MLPRFFLFFIPLLVFQAPLPLAAQNNGEDGGRGTTLPDKSPKEMFPSEVTKPLREGFSLLRESPPPLEDLDDEHEGADGESPSQKTPKSIVEQFGSPDENEPIKMVESTPRPYQAMVAALQAGDEELAWRYSRKFARYLRDMKSMQAQVVGLQAKALEAEGLVDGSGWTSSKTFEHYNKYLAKDKEAQAVENEEKSLARFLPRELHDRALSVPETNEGAEDLLYNAEQTIVQMAQALSGQLTPDPEGRIDIYFALRPRDAESIKMAAEIERLYQVTKQDDKVNLVGFAVESQSSTDLQAFQRGAKITFPIIDGGSLSEVFQIKETPAVVFVGATDTRQVQEVGFRRFEFLEALRRVLQGGGVASSPARGRPK